MDRRKGLNVPDLKRSLSSLSYEITNWSASRSCSPSAKKSKRPSNVDAQDLQAHNLSTDLAVSNFDSIPWYEKYTPRKVSEVSIHKRKLKEVHDELEAMLQGRSDKRILLLTGPSGCCKSTVATLLAKELVPRYRANSARRNEDIIRYENDTTPNGGSYMNNFGEFLSEAKYRIGSNLSLVLVEDVPNVFHTESRNAFQRQLLEWLYMPRRSLPPLVICLTECELENDSGNSGAYGIDYSWTAESILGREILSHVCLKRVKFNPVNATLMRKTLVGICHDNKAQLLQLKKWNDKEKVIGKLIKSTGDVRSGVAMLQFWATSRGSALSDMRESSTSYFHAIGRVLHGSRDNENDNEMINELVSTSKGHLSHENFSLGILENYSSFNKGQFSLLDASNVTDSLSESNAMSLVPESLEFCLRKVRHTLGGIDQGSHSHGRPKFPREWKIRKLQNEFTIESEDYTNVSMYKYGEPRLFRNIALQFGFYDPKIRRTRFYKQKALNHYKAKLRADTAAELTQPRPHKLDVDPALDIITRIGGEINLIETQDTEVFEDDHKSTARESLDQLKRRRDAKVQKLQESYVVDSDLTALTDTEDEPFEDDPIVDSDDGGEAIANSTLDDDDSIYEAFSQKRPDPNCERPVDESLSDSDLEGL